MAASVTSILLWWLAGHAVISKVQLSGCHRSPDCEQCHQWYTIPTVATSWLLLFHLSCAVAAVAAVHQCWHCTHSPAPQHRWCCCVSTVAYCNLLFFPFFKRPLSLLSELQCGQCWCHRHCWFVPCHWLLFVFPPVAWSGHCHCSLHRIAVLPMVRLSPLSLPVDCHCRAWLSPLVECCFWQFSPLTCSGNTTAPWCAEAVSTKASYRCHNRIVCCQDVVDGDGRNGLMLAKMTFWKMFPLNP